MSEQAEHELADAHARARLRVLGWAALAVYGASLAASVELYGGFWTSQRMGDQVPWYFIGRSFFGGLWALIALLLLGVLAVTIGRGLGRSTWNAVMPVLLFLSPPLAQGVNVLLHTERIWSPEAAVSHWHTVDAFQRSDAIAMFTGLAVMVVVVVPNWPGMSLLPRGGARP